MSKRNTLLVVAKRPFPGQTKTRLCPPLSYTQAADLYECFLRDTLDVMRQVAGVQRVIGFLPEGAQDYFGQLAPDMELTRQFGASLGERLDHLLTEALAGGSQRAVVMDSDSPTLPSEYISQAFDRLNDADVVLGPTRDGGYYLIGMKQPQSHLLRQVQMSTPRVLTDTVALAESTGLTVSLLPTWHDVDTIADLYRLDEEIMQLSENGRAAATRDWLARTDWRDHRAWNMRVSVIIPALNEAESLGLLLDEVPTELIHEVIVVDNGSTDNTAEVAQAAGAVVIHEPRRGYGFACAAGTVAAEGDVLVFLDGDGSFAPGELIHLLTPLARGEADLVLGSRLRRDGVVMLPHQRFGNLLFAWLLRQRFGLRLTDLGPYRAVRRELLLKLDMQEHTYGWPLEMIIKTARRRDPIVEVPVTYRPRFAGQSKVGGTLRGSVLAAYRFFYVLFRYAI